MAGPAFAQDIKPLFLGTMPCDEQWRSENIDLFEQWIAGGMAE
jgi:hypothetical protein